MDCLNQTKPCVFCTEPCNPAPTDRGWLECANNQRIHRACIDKLADTLRRIRDFPLVVCLCGSTRFTDTMLLKQWELTKQGRIVLTWCVLPESYFKGPHIGDAEGVKDIVDEVHKRKIDLSGEIFVINVGGYVGESTRSEIRYALEHDKKIRWLEPDSAQRILDSL